MGNSQQVMPKVNFKEDANLKSAHMYSKYLETKNLERAVQAKRTVRFNRISFTVSVATVIAIYTYTLVKIKQETFLDDFEEPPRVIKTDS